MVVHLCAILNYEVEKLQNNISAVWHGSSSSYARAAVGSFVLVLLLQCTQASAAAGKVIV